MAAESTGARRVLILGAGFAGLSAARVFEEADEADAARVRVTLLDVGGPRNIGAYNQLVLGGDLNAEDVVDVASTTSLRLSRVQFVQGKILRIDTDAKTVFTRGESFGYDELIVALGMDYDLAATPGFAECGYNICSLDDMVELRGALARLQPPATVAVAVCGLPYKCPPVPFEISLVLDRVLSLRLGAGHPGVRIVLITPMARAVPPFAPHVFETMMQDQGIEFMAGRQIVSVDPASRTLHFESGEPLAFDLLAATPVQRPVAAVRAALPLGKSGFVKTQARSMRTPVANVYCCGDNAEIALSFPDPVGVQPHPKAGGFAINYGMTAARSILADAAARAAGTEPAWDAPLVQLQEGSSCYVEGPNRTGFRIKFDLFSNPARPNNAVTDVVPTGAAEKLAWAADLRRQWYVTAGERQ